MRHCKRWLAVFVTTALAAGAMVGCGSGSGSIDKTTAAAAQASKEENQTSEDVTTTATAAAAVVASKDDVNVNDDGTVNHPEKVKVDANKLVLWSLFSGGDGAFMDQIISNYNAGGPTKQVQSIMLVWADYYTKLETAVAAGKGPDIGISHVSSLPQLVEDGVVQPITPYLEDMGINLNDHYSNIKVDSVTFNGKVYAVPLDTHAEIMYFNKDILSKAGVKLNSAGAVDINSAEDLYAVCDKLKAVMPDGGSPIALTQNGDDPYRVWWASYFQMEGTPIVSDDGTKVTLNKDIAVKAAEFVKGLYDKGYIAEGIDDHQKLFQAGKAGICITGTWAVGAFEQTDNLNFVPASFPQLFGNHDCWADSHTFTLPTKKSRSEEDSKAAVAFMVSASMKGG